MIRSAEEFVSLRRSPLKCEYDRAANDEAPVSVWYDVIRGFPEMRVWVDHNKMIHEEIILVLAKDHDPDVRLSVAMKRRCPAAVLARLAWDPEFRVRMAVVRNRRVPTSVLSRLADEASGPVADEARRQLQHRKALGE